jgi:Protein of unknown function (DUF4038)/Putative collagen-binding domain of a collagenase
MINKQNFRLAGIIVLVILTGLFVFGSLCQAQSGASAGKPGEMRIYPYAFPLKPGPGNRYLVDQSNQPFFWSGDAAWSLVAQLNLMDAGLYLDNRSEKGFTVVMVNLIEHKFCTNPPANINGDLPFSCRPFASPNEKYFAHADSVIESAVRHNIIVLLAPLYLGYDCKDEGWCEEVKEASSGDLLSWGRYLGNRYKKFSNIIWLIGGDASPLTVKDKVLEMVKGIRENDTLHLFSAHNQPESMAITPWADEQWLSLNNVYSYDSVLYKRYRTAYDHLPVMPYFQIESAYENEHNSTPQQLCSQAYWAILSGAMGHVFGNCPVWHFGAAEKWCNTTDWKKEMNNSGSRSMDYLQRLFRSRSWQKLIPDFENNLITSGYGIRGIKDHVAGALTSDGNTIIAYLPSPRKVTVNMTGIHGVKAKCWWYRPSDGTVIEIGTYTTSSVHSFTPVSSGDWVLVIDNESAKLPAPGRESLINAVKVRK